MARTEERSQSRRPALSSRRLARENSDSDVPASSVRYWDSSISNSWMYSLMVMPYPRRRSSYFFLYSSVWSSCGRRKVEERMYVMACLAQ